MTPTVGTTGEEDGRERRAVEGSVFGSGTFGLVQRLGTLWRSVWKWRELASLRSELDSLDSRIDQWLAEFDGLERGDLSPAKARIAQHLERAKEEIKLADQALERDGVVSFWRHFAEAKKSEIEAIEQLYHGSVEDDRVYPMSLLDGRAQDALLQAADVLDDDQLHDVERGLSREEAGSLAEYSGNIARAIHTIHRRHISDHLEWKRGKLLESQLQFFMTVIVACLALVFYVWMTFFGSVGATDSTPLFSIEFIVTIVLFGAMGAAVSSLTNLSKVLKSSNVPERVGSVRLAVGRVVLGAASSLIVYVFVFAEVFNVFRVTASSLLAVAFVSGFSERLLMRTVRNFTGEEGGRPGRADPGESAVASPTGAPVDAIEPERDWRNRPGPVSEEPREDRVPEP